MMTRDTVSWVHAAGFGASLAACAPPIEHCGDSGSEAANRESDDGGSGAVENVLFGSPLSGTHTYWVDNFPGSAASFNLSAYEGGSRVGLRGGSVDSGGESGRYTLDYP